MAAISVLVPVYNVENYLSGCVESILNQSFGDFELLLADDGSTDGSGVLCDSLAQTDSRIHVLHQANSGPAGIRNAALAWAYSRDGEWVAFVDSDDTLAENYLERLLSVAQSYDAQIASCAVVTYSTQEQLEKINREQTPVTVYSGTQACEEVYKINGATVVSCPGKLIRKELFRNFTFPEGKIHEDEALIPKVMYTANRIAVCGDRLYFYYQSANSIMRKPFNLRRFEAVEAIDTCIAFFQNHGEQTIVQLAKTRRTVILALNIGFAKKAGLYRQIPADYRMPLWKAMWQVEKCTSFDEFTWHLGKFYPGLVRPYAYYRKLKKLLHLKKTA